MWREEMRKKKLIVMVAAIVVLLVAHAPEIAAYLEQVHAVAVARRMAGVHVMGGLLLLVAGILWLWPVSRDEFAE